MRTLGWMVFALVGVACSSTGSGKDGGDPDVVPMPNNDSGSMMDSGGSTDCNPIQNTSMTTVQVMNVNQNPPQGMGGTIVDGTYIRTKAEYYTGPNGASGPTGDTTRHTIQIMNGGKYMKSAESKNGKPDGFLYFNLNAQGMGVTVATTCGMTAGATWAYTATPTQLIVHDTTSEPGKYKVQTFTKQ